MSESSQRLANAVQIVTGIALLAGILLVFFELRQAKTLTLAELTSAGYSEALQDNRVIMGENSAVVFAKSCYSPDAMTTEDLVILDAFYRTQVAEISRLRVLEQISDFGVPWEAVARQQLTTILATEHGRWWFAEYLGSDAALARISQDVLATQPNCADFYTRFAGRIDDDERPE